MSTSEIPFKIRRRQGAPAVSWTDVTTVMVPTTARDPHQDAMRRYIAAEGGVIPTGIYEAVPASQIRQYDAKERPRLMDISLRTA